MVRYALQDRISQTAVTPDSHSSLRDASRTRRLQAEGPFSEATWPPGDRNALDPFVGEGEA